MRNILTALALTLAFSTVVSAQELAWQEVHNPLDDTPSYELVLTAPLFGFDAIPIIGGVGCKLEQHRGHNTNNLYWLYVFDGLNQWSIPGIENEPWRAWMTTYMLYPDPESGHTVLDPNVTIGKDEVERDMAGVHDYLDECALVTEGLPEHLVEVMRNADKPTTYWQDAGQGHSLVGGRKGLVCRIVTDGYLMTRSSTFVMLRAYEESSPQHADAWYVRVDIDRDANPRYRYGPVIRVEDSGHGLAEECLRTTRAGLVLDDHIVPALFPPE